MSFGVFVKSLPIIEDQSAHAGHKDLKFWIVPDAGLWWDAENDIMKAFT